MTQQLFDLDQALDAFENEELDKLSSNASSALFSAKPVRTVSFPEEPSGNVCHTEDVPSIMCLLNSSGETSGKMHNITSLRPEILYEDAKDICADFVNHSQSSIDRTNHLVLEEQSSSNMDSGLCSSSEFTSLDAGELPMPAFHLNKMEDAVVDNLSASTENFNTWKDSAASESQTSYTDDVAMLFSASNDKTCSDTPNGNDVSIMKTPTRISPDSSFSMATSENLVNTENRLAVCGTSSLPCTSSETQTPTRPNALDYSADDTSTRNNPFFFPDDVVAAKQLSSPFHSLPVVSSHADVSVTNGSAQNNLAGGCRRPSSLLLVDSMAECQKPLLHHPVGTKRPSSLFGLPCISGPNELSVSSPQQDKKMMLQPVVTSVADVNGDHIAASVVTMECEQKSSQMQMNDQTAGILVAPIVYSTGRRSPSTCSASSEIIQLPVPTVPSSTSSYSPDSASLSRSSLCDGMPSPTVSTQPSFISSGGNGGSGDSPNNDPVDTAFANSEMIMSTKDEGAEDEEMAALNMLEAAVATQESRLLPCGESLGRQAPPWVPDSDAPCCSGCGVRFTFTKRRHHCRACGKVFCNSCCSLRFHLEFLNAIARVCVVCYPELIRLEARRNNAADTGPPVAAPSALRNVLKARSASSHRSNDSRRKQKQVVFSDGIRPGEHLAPQSNQETVANGTDELSSPETSPDGHSCSGFATTSGISSEGPSSLIEKALPTITGHFSWAEKSKFLKNGVDAICSGNNVILAINSRLAVRIQKVDMSCCCPSFTSHPEASYYAVVSIGMCAAAESEYVVIIRTATLGSYLELIVKFFERLWADAEQGRYYDEFSCVSIEPVGFLVFRPSFQCTQHLPLPSHSRWLASVVIVDANELAWARLFPLRLLLRLGHEFGHYPTSIVSDVTRQPLFHQAGHTVLSLFSDFRSFRYRLETIDGAVLHLDRATTAGVDDLQEPRAAGTRNFVGRRHVLLLPVTAASQVRQLALAGHEHVLAIGTSFSPSADGHLVAVQASSPDATYRTEAITMLGIGGAAIGSTQIRILAGSFIIFNGSLRPDNGTRARFTVLEDGAMVQITAEQMAELRSSLAAKQNFSVSCSTANSSDSDADDTLQIEWVQNTSDMSPWSRPQYALRCRLPIGFHTTMLASMSNGGLSNSSATIRITAAFSWPFDSNLQFLWCSPSVYSAAAGRPGTMSSSTATEQAPSQASAVTYVLDRASLAFASATQLALSPYADEFVRTARSRSCELPVQILVRIRLDPESLGFEATMMSTANCGEFAETSGAVEYLPLPDAVVESLDSELIPTLFNVAQALGSKLPTGGLCLELVIFAVPPVVVTDSSPTTSPSNITFETSAHGASTAAKEESFDAGMLVDSS